MDSNRLHSLDYLRGITAFGIMIYHYTGGICSRSADTIMGRLGVYGVAIFYILSGLTLFHVYNENMKPTWSETKSFFKKRIFRIFPLLWVVTIVAVLVSQKTPNFFDLFLNLSGLFGFVAWDVTFSGGVWSIGNELVFYVFFPIFIYLSHKSQVWFWVLGVIIFLIFIYFAFIKIHYGMPMLEETSDYFNPLNNLFLFFGGFIIGKYLKRHEISSIILHVIIIVGLGLFVFYPVFGKKIDLLIGVNRLVFTLSSCMICIYFYKLSYQVPTFIHKPLLWLGEVSYSLYLIHPIVIRINRKFLEHYFIDLPSIKITSMFVCIIITLVLSYFSYNYLEKFFMKLGRKNTYFNIYKTYQSNN
jgi:exopolysaccharide production protein ExoZ